MTVKGWWGQVVIWRHSIKHTISKGHALGGINLCNVLSTTCWKGCGDNHNLPLDGWVMIHTGTECGTSAFWAMICNFLGCRAFSSFLPPERSYIWKFNSDYWQCDGSYDVQPGRKLIAFNCGGHVICGRYDLADMFSLDCLYVLNVSALAVPPLPTRRRKSENFLVWIFCFEWRVSDVERWLCSSDRTWTSLRLFGERFRIWILGNESSYTNRQLKGLELFCSTSKLLMSGCYKTLTLQGFCNKL